MHRLLRPCTSEYTGRLLDTENRRDDPSQSAANNSVHSEDEMQYNTTATPNTNTLHTNVTTELPVAIQYVICKPDGTIVFATATGKIMCWHWKQDILECWCQDEINILGLSLPYNFSLPRKGAIFASQKPCCLFSLQKTSTNVIEKKILLHSEWRNSGTIPPSIRNLSFDQGMVFFSIHHQLFCCDSTSGEVIASFRQQFRKQPTESKQKYNEEDNVQIQAVRKHDKCNGTGVSSKSDEILNASGVSTTISSSFITDLQHRSPDAQCNIYREVGNRTFLISSSSTQVHDTTEQSLRHDPHEIDFPSDPIASSHYSDIISPIARILSVVVTDVSIMVQYPCLVFVFGRFNFRKRPFQVIRVIQNIPSSDHLATTGLGGGVFFCFFILN